MISLTCTSCKKTLQIDDAFAGGVCRCQFCGTIQTVPSAAKIASRPGAPPPVTTGAKTLYQKKGRAAAAQSANQSGSGLDDLAGAVASSSGLARGALRTRAATPVAPPPPAKDSKKLLLAVVAVLVVIILVLVGILVFR